MNKASLIGISRLRMGTDGRGVTTLVAFHGCPLRCKYCLNPQSLDVNAKVLKKTPQEVMATLKKDELYFRATGGGVTFGGGEPLLRADFIKEVLELGAKQWHVTVETSLNVPLERWQMLVPYIDEYIIDVKDMDSAIYQAYCGKDNTIVKSNLRWLIQQGKAANIVCRIPLIPEYNTPEGRKRSKEEIEKIAKEVSDNVVSPFIDVRSKQTEGDASYAITRFDFFTYKTHK